MAEAAGAVRFAHLSDPHLSDLAEVVRPRHLLGKRAFGFYSWLRRRRREHRREVLAALVADLAPWRPQRVLVTGDLTHLGLPAEFAQVRAWLASLPFAAVSLVPGNHDSYAPEPWAATYAQWAEWLGVEAPDGFPTLARLGRCAFVGLSTAHPSAPGLAVGTLGAAQLARLERTLAALGAEGCFRVVLIHHPPFPGMEKWRKRLTDAAQLAAVVERVGAELVLYGHSHRFCVARPALGSHAPVVVGAASASARGEHAEAASYNRFALSEAEDGWRLELECRRWDASAGGFATADRRVFTFPAGPQGSCAAIAASAST
ncbi:MAG: metallophosphoesterase [Porticoccaceae bacterium]|nr:MAG: metallophosphoesterase [Porticoccaceae bacterium]